MFIFGQGQKYFIIQLNLVWFCLVPHYLFVKGVFLDHVAFVPDLRVENKKWCIKSDYVTRSLMFNHFTSKRYILYSY